MARVLDSDHLGCVGAHQEGTMTLKECMGEPPVSRPWCAPRFPQRISSCLRSSQGQIRWKRRASKDLNLRSLVGSDPRSDRHPRRADPFPLTRTAGIDPHHRPRMRRGGFPPATHPVDPERDRGGGCARHPTMRVSEAPATPPRTTYPLVRRLLPHNPRSVRLGLHRIPRPQCQAYHPGVVSRME